jgi:hypothetical protein
MMASETTPSKRSSPIAWVLAGVAALIIDAAAVWGAIIIVQFRLDTAAPVGTAPTSAPEPSRTPSPTPTFVDERVPAQCQGLYSAGMMRNLRSAGLDLGRPVSGDALYGGTGDADLRVILDASTVLSCDWLDKDGGEKSGIRSAVAVVGDSEQAAAVDRVRAMKLTRLDQLGGQRFFVESVDANGRQFGESHFFRDGLWFATHWYGHGPMGYSADMVDAVFK